MFQQYYGENTIILSHNILPIELKDKTNKELLEFLSNPDENNQTLRAKLSYFNDESNRAKTARQQGRVYGYFKIPWITVSDIKYLSQQDIILLNYFIMTDYDSTVLSSFAYAVKVSVDMTFYAVFNKEQQSTKRCVCNRIVYDK